MSIIRTEAYYHSTNGEDMIRALIWRNDELPPIGILQIAHGLTDHIDRYDRFARYVCEKGYVVCGNDHLGHGKEAQKNGKLGNFGAHDTDIRMVDDMNVLCKIMQKKYEGLPYFLLGHSMGSFLARIFHSQFGEKLSGLILCGSTQMGGKIPGLKDFVLPLGELLGPDKYSSTGSDVMGKITMRYYKEEDDSSWLSLSRENRDEALADPLFDFPITTNSAMIVAKLLFKASENICYQMMPQDVPVMLLSGGKDPISLFGRGVTALCDKFEENGIETEMKLYPGLRHELLNEDDYEPIYNDILKWMEKSNTIDYSGDFI